MWLSCDHHYQVITAGVCNGWKHKSVIYRKYWKICLCKTTHHQWSMISSFSLQASHIIRLVPTSPSINMSLRGEVNYRDHLSTQQRLFLDLNTARLDRRSFVIFHNRVSLCVWKLACQKVRMWLCHHLHSSSSPPSLLLLTTFTPPPHHLHSSSSPPSLLLLTTFTPPPHHLHSSSSLACVHSDGLK